LETAILYFTFFAVCGTGIHRHPDHMHSDVIHVATTTPVCLYSMDTRKQHSSCVDLYDAFPGSTARYHSYRPRLHLAPLGFPLDANIIIHDELVSVAYCAVVLLINTLSTFTNNSVYFITTFKAYQHKATCRKTRLSNIQMVAMPFIQ